MIDETLLQRFSLLARVRIAPEDIPKRIQDFEGILKCISEINSIVIPSGFQMNHTHINITRPDVVSAVSSETVGRIVDVFPDKVDTHLSVPVIF
jgi:Asp-tRNA(Asn)/Glu-tRNA(Gln) amidotransferase C subunit